MKKLIIIGLALTVFSGCLLSPEKKTEYRVVGTFDCRSLDDKKHYADSTGINHWEGDCSLQDTTSK